MSVRRFCAITLLLALGLAAFGVRSVRLFGADEKDTATAIAMREKALAEKALTLITTLEQQGQVNPGLGDVPRWSRRLVEATRRSGANKAEVIAALKQHVARMDDRVQRVTRLYDAQAAVLGDVLNAEYEALEAKGWLYEEQGN